MEPLFTDYGFEQALNAIAADQLYAGPLSIGVFHGLLSEDEPGAKFTQGGR